MITNACYDLTVRQLMLSLQSTTCLACGDYKTVRNSLCGKCYRQLSEGLKRDLYKHINNGYREAILAALGFLKVTRPILPGDEFKRMDQGIKREAITPDVAVRAMKGRICPACCKTKSFDQLFCNVDLNRLREKLDHIQGKSSDLLFTEKLETVEQVFAPSRLRQSPEAFCESFFLALHKLNCTRVYLQRDNPRERAVVVNPD